MPPGTDTVSIQVNLRGKDEVRVKGEGPYRKGFKDHEMHGSVEDTTGGSPIRIFLYGASIIGS